MSGTQAPVREPAPGGKSAKVWRLLILLVAGIIAAGLINANTIGQIMRGETSVRDVLAGERDWPEGEPLHFIVPEDTGSADARVVMEVFVLDYGSCDCYIEPAYLGSAVGKIDPERIRVEFRKADEPRNKERLMDLTNRALDRAMFVNEEHNFEIPDPDNPGKTRRVDLLDHDALPASRDLWQVLDRALKSEYDGEGMSVTPEEFEKRVSEYMEENLIPVAPEPGDAGSPDDRRSEAQ